MADGDRSAPLLARLAVPGERLGWIFTDRRLYRRRFLEPEPQRGDVPKRPLRYFDAARTRFGHRLLATLRGVGIVAVLVGIFGLIGGARFVEVLGLAAGLIVACTIIVAVLMGVRLLLAWLVVVVAAARVGRKHVRALSRWHERRRRHDEQQQEAVEAMLEWSGAAPAAGTGRVDIVGGTVYGWEALLTVFGGSLLATHGPMTLVDFTGDTVCGELIRLAQVTGRTVAERRLPAELTRFDPFGGLGPGELVTCLVEAMYGDAQGASRADRSQDTLLLTEICQVLAPRLTMARLLAAVRVLLSHPAPEVLTHDETDRLLDLHPDDGRRQLQVRLRRIEAFVHPLETMGGDPAAPREADLFCLLVDDEGRSAGGESLKETVVQWLARQVRPQQGYRGPRGSLVVIGADEVSHRALEQLGARCERGGLRLVLLFAHLREESVPAIGGGEVAFMRLGNHHEAAQAADFIGKGHRFVLSQLTKTLGGNETHGETETFGESATESMTSGETWGNRIGQGSSQFSETLGFTRSWGRTESLARGTNWSDAEARQRVYEYAVEPRALQDLPDYALIMVERQRDGSVVRAVEVNPEIVTLPRLSMDPVEMPELPHPDEAVHPFEAPARPGS